MEIRRETVDSNVPWIGDIPDGWTISRIGDVSILSAGIPAPEDAQAAEDLKSGIPFIRVSDLSSWASRMTGETRDSIPKSYTANKKQKGTIIFPKSGESIRGGVRKVLSEDAVVVSHLACAKARNEISTDEYFYWTLEAVDFEDETNQTSLPSLNLSAIASKPIPLAPLSEQQAIAAYLDHHTSLIDRERDLITKKIELLKEKRKALIFEVVTGKRTIVEAQALAGDGGDRMEDVVFAGEWAAVPTPKSDDAFVKMGRLVDSGSHWIGEVPDTWTMTCAKNILSKNSIPAEDTDGVVTCFRDGQVTLRSLRRSGGFTVAMKEHGYQGVRQGHLVIHAMDAFAGAIGVSEADGKCSPVYSVCSMAYGSHAKYYAYLFRVLALTGYIESVAKGIRERSTDFRFLEVGKTIVPCPPHSEQILIGNFLDYSNILIDREISLLQRKAELLSEKRKAIIFEAVTGKIDLNYKNAKGCL